MPSTPPGKTVRDIAEKAEPKINRKVDAIGPERRSVDLVR